MATKTRSSGRRKTAVTVFTLALAAWLVHSAALAQDSQPPPSQIVVSSLPHPATNVRWGRAVGVVDASVEQVMAIVHDYGSYGEFIPYFHISRVLSQRGNRALVYMQARLAKGVLNVWANMKLDSRKRADGSYVVEAKMTKGNMEQMKARWEVTPLPDGRTRVAFQMIMDPDLPMPAGFITAQNEKASKKTIKALRKRLAGAGRHG